MKKRGYIVGRMLAVAIQEQRPARTQAARAQQTLLNRRALSLVEREAQNFRARGLRLTGRAVGRSVIHDDHLRYVEKSGPHQRTDGRGLIVAGDHGDTVHDYTA